MEYSWGVPALILVREAVMRLVHAYKATNYFNLYISYFLWGSQCAECNHLSQVEFVDHE